MVSLSQLDVIVLTQGADNATGDATDAIIHGDLGNDTVTGGSGNETIIGGSGNDQLDGGFGDDVLHGGAGNDFLVYEFEFGRRDRYFGDAGSDTLILRFQSAYFSTAIQAEVGAYAAMLAAGQDPGAGGEFAFQTFGLRATSIENLLLFVDGIETNPADAPRGTVLPDAFAVSEDATLLTADVSLNDAAADGDVYTLVIADQSPASLTLRADGTFDFRPNGAFEDLGVGETATFRFTYELQTPFTANRATATITITGANDAPQAGNAQAATDEDTPILIDLLDLAGATDPDVNDNLVVSALNGFALDVAARVVALQSGAEALAPNSGVVTYDPNGAFDFLREGESAEDVVTFVVSDGRGGLVTRTLTVEISGLNDAPVAVDDAAATDQDSFVDINFRLNDFDPDAEDSISLEAFDETGAAGGVLLGNEGGGLTFNPNGDFDDLGAGETRETTFSYTISDEAGAEGTGTITVTVTGLNDAPTDGFLSAGDLTEDETLTGNLILDSGVTDIDATDVLTILAVDGVPLVGDEGVFFAASGATLTVSADGGFTYDPRAAFDSLAAQGVGFEIFTVTVSDGNGGTSEIFASLTILGVNDAPVAEDDFFAAFADAETAVDPLANDTDVDGPFILETFDETGSAGGRLENVEGELRFNPGEDFLDLAPGETRATTFSYSISDDAGAESTATITVTVTGVAQDNSPPVGGEAVLETDEDGDGTGGNLFFETGAFDPDPGDVVSVVSVNGVALTGADDVFFSDEGAAFSIVANGDFGFDGAGALDFLAEGETLDIVFDILIADLSGATADVTLTFAVSGVNDAPVAVDDAVSAFADAETTFDPLANDFDVDDSFFLIEFSGTGDAGGRLAEEGGLLVFNPGEDFLDLEAGETRVTTFSYTIADDFGAEATATITVTVTGVDGENSPPEGGSFILEIDEDDFVSDNLFDLAGAFDPDGDDIFSISVDGAPLEAGVLEFFTEGGLLVVVEEDGSFSVDASGSFDFLREGEIASEQFTVEIVDGFGGEAQVTATIDIFGVNDAPEVEALEFNFSQNDAAGPLGLLDGVFDAEDDPLSIAFFAQTEGPDVFEVVAPLVIRHTGFASSTGLFATVVGDVNGDGVADIFFGSRNVDAARLALGGDANFLAGDLQDGVFDGSIRLADQFLPGVLKAYGDGIYFNGPAGEIGDVNGDGFDDFLIDASGAYEGRGVVYLVFGGEGGPQAFDPDFRPGAAGSIMLVGEGTGGFFGSVLPKQPLGDITGDGVADFLIGAPRNDQNGVQDAGAVFIVSGGGLAAAGADGRVDEGEIAASGGYRIDGLEYGGYRGAAISSGDIDGDGVADILIAASGERVTDLFRVGKTYLIFGGQAALEALDEAEEGADDNAIQLGASIIDGVNGFVFDNAGRAVAVLGDVNGDGFDDFAIGGYLPLAGDLTETYIIFGGRENLVALDFSDGAADGVINLDRVQGEGGFNVSGFLPNDRAGYTLSDAGDIDGDGLADILVSSIMINDGNGVYSTRSFLIFGGQLDALDAADETDGAVSLGALDGTFGYVFEFEGAAFQASIDAADVTGDGIVDLIFTDPGFSSSGVSAEGASFIIPNAAANLATLDAFDGATDGRIDLALVSGRIFDVSVAPQGALILFGDDAEFDPSRFAFLGAGESETVVIEYGVFDGTDETVNTVTITITGENDAPTGGDVSFEIDEDSLDALNILEASGAFDVDANDILTVLEFDGVPLNGGTESFVIGESESLEVSAGGSVTIDGDFDFLRAGESLQFSFTFTVSDLAGETFTNDYSFTIIGVNDEPVAEDDAAETDQDTTVDVFVDENDFDEDDDFTIVAIDAAGSVGGVLTDRDLGGHVFDPNGEFDDLAAGETRDTVFLYTIRDETGAEATASLTVTVSGLNDAPTGGDASFATDEDTDLSGDLLAGSNAADVDNGDSLRLTAINGQALTAGQVSVTFGSGAVLTANEDGTFSFTAAGNYENLAAGAQATETVSFTIADAAGASFTASATIRIDGVNDAPAPQNDAAETDEDTAIEIDLGGNDTDVDDATLTFGFPDTAGDFGFADVVLDFTGAGDAARALGAGDGVFVSVPLGTSLTVAFVDEIVTDGFGPDLFIGEIGPGGEAATIEVSSDGVNFTFLGVADNNTTTAFDLADIGFTGQLVAVRISGLDNGGSSPGFDVDFVQAVGLSVEGTRGELTDLGGGVVRYDPSGALDFLREGDVFIDRFTYTVTDAAGAVGVAVAEVTVNGVNDAPTGEDASFSTDEETDLSGDLLIASVATDVDEDDVLSLVAINGQALTAGQVTVTFGSGATLTANEDGTFSFAAAGNYEGLAAGESATEAVSFTVADEAGASFTASLTIRIDGLDELAPVAADDAATVNEESQISVAVLNNDDAPGGGPLTTSLVAGQTFIGAVTVLANQSIQFNPVGAYDFLGVGESATETIRYLATDSSNGLSDEGLFTVTITGVNDRPTGGSITDQTDEDTALTGNVIADSGAADRDANDVLRVLDVIIGGVRTGVTGTQSFTTASGATLTISEDGTYEYSPVGAFDALAAGETSAPDSFSVTLDDQTGAGLTTATVTLSITVTGVNDAPVANGETVTTDEDSQSGFIFFVNDFDPDFNDTRTLVAIDETGSAGGVMINVPGGAPFFDPNGEFDDLAEGESRTTTFSYTISDEAGAEATSTITVIVTGVNDAPTGGDVFFGPLEEDAIGFGFLIASSNATDPDAGDTLSVTAVNGQPLVAGEISFTLGSGATLTVQENGEARLGAAGFYDGLDAGETLDEVFSFTISDAAGASFTASATFQILGVNDPLIVSEATDPDPVPEGDVGILTNVDFDLITFVTATDADEDDTPAVDPASVSIVANAASDTADASSFAVGGGSVVVDTANFDFLAGGEFGIFDVTFDIVSGEERVTRTITITITGEDDGPVANDDAATTDEETPITVDVTANDTPGEFGLRLVPGQEFSGQAGFDAGRLFFDPSGDFDFLAVGETATESIFYEIRDGETGLTDTAEVRITITGVNDAPVSESGGTPGVFRDFDEDTLFSANLIAGDNPVLDADTNDVLRVTVVDGRAVTGGAITFTGASGATVTVTESGDITVDPRNALNRLGEGDSEFEGFFYTVSDGNGGEIQGFASLTITGVNDAPEVTAINIEASELDDEFELDLFELARDAENDTLTISDFRQVSGLTAIAGQGLAGMRFEGDIDYGYAGDPAGLGDINGDGIDDFVFFRRGYSEGDNERGFIVFGESPAQETLDAADGAPDAVAGAGRIDSGTGLFLLSESNYGGRYLGAGPMGDINGDGFAELLIADAYAGPNNGGAVFTIFGGKDAIGALGGTLDLSAVPAGAGFRLALGAGIAGDAFGGVLPDSPVGDVNGDGVADLLIGSERGNRTDAFVHFVSGGALARVADAAGNVDVNDLLREADGSAYRFVGGPQTDGEDASLRSLGLATGDIDGDGIDDFLISASIDNYASNGPGESYIVFGGRDALDAADLADGARDGEISVDVIGAAGGFTLVGAAFEPAVIGDVNGDGIADFAVADREGYADGLNVFVLFGGRDNLAGLDDADGVRDGRLDPFRAAEEGFGFTFRGLTGGEGGLETEVVALGDIDGDGLTDFAIANGSNRLGGGGYAGEVHIALSSTLGQADNADGARDRSIDVGELYTIRATPSTTTSGTGATFADRIASADINGDGFLDLLIGEARFYDGDRFASGAVHVVFGGGGIRLREIDSGNDQFLLIGDTLGLVTATGNQPAGALVFNDPVSFNPSAFGFLEAGEEEVLVFEFTVSDGLTEAVNTLTIRVTGEEIDLGSGFGQFLSEASKPLVADELAFGLESARTVAAPEPADARLFGSSGSEFIRGTENADTIRAGDGNDRVFAEEGRDVVFGEGGDDELRGGRGRDTIFGGQGEDTIFGQGFDDLMSGGAGDDVLNGGRGNDTLRGNRDDDTLIGGNGDDRILGGLGQDRLVGGGGFDVLNGGAGADVLIGGFGVDRFVFTRGFGNDRLLDYALFEKLDFSAHDGVSGFADLTITARGADTLVEDGLGGRLALIGVSAADIDADNFLF